MWLARERSLHVVNVDSTILLERPKLRTYVDSMRENIADVLGIDAGLCECESEDGRRSRCGGAGARCDRSGRCSYGEQLRKAA